MEHSNSLKNIFENVCKEITDFRGHIFWNDYKYIQHYLLSKSLPEDHAIAYAPFSQNYVLVPSVEFQSMHTMHLICHASASTADNPQLTREAVVIVSDDMELSTSAVYNFTLKLLSCMRDNPEKVSLPRVLHRITDNCGFE